MIIQLREKYTGFYEEKGIEWPLLTITFLLIFSFMKGGYYEECWNEISRPGLSRN